MGHALGDADRPAELVAKGVTFTNGFVVNSLCCPSRTSILTGESTSVVITTPP